MLSTAVACSEAFFHSGYDHPRIKAFPGLIITGFIAHIETGKNNISATYIPSPCEHLCHRSSGPFLLLWHPVNSNRTNLSDWTTSAKNKRLKKELPTLFPGSSHTLPPRGPWEWGWQLYILFWRKFTLTVCVAFMGSRTIPPSS